MKPRWRNIILSLVLVLFLGLAFWQQAFFYTYLIKPIASILWLIYRTFLSIDQELYWGLLILTSLILILRIISIKPQGSYYHPAYHSPIQKNDPVARWEALLENAEASENDRLVLQHELEALHRSIEALAERNETGQIHLPPVKKGLRQRVYAVRKSLPLLRIMPHQNHETTEIAKQVDIIVKSMETKLEIDHDGISNHTHAD